MADGNAPGPPAEGGRVASEQEVLEFLTDVMRGGMESEGKAGAATPRMRAAELLGKRLGVFSESPPPAATPVIIDDVGPTEDG